MNIRNRRRRTLAVLLLALFLTACSARRDYQAASGQDTIEAYTRFLQQHPQDKKHAPQARTRLEELSFEAARRENTFDAYAGFIGRFPFGRFSAQAMQRAEDIRAAEVGIHLYRRVPDDYYERVDSAALPFRIRVICPSTDEQEKNHVERKWHEELVRRGLFVPLDPRKAYPFPADMTLRVRESTLYLFTYPWTKVDAEVWVRERHVRTYRIAAQRIEKPLLYEIYGDSELYRSLLRVPDEDRLAVEERFGQLRRNPLPAGSICLEFEIDQRGSHWDQDMIRSFLEFLKGLEFWEDLHVYPRGHPPPATGSERLFLRADPEFHHPVLHRRWNFVGPGPDWSAWNSAWILVERDHFFRKMTLDLLDALQEPVHLKEDSASRDPARTGGRTRPIWTAP